MTYLDAYGNDAPPRVIHRPLCPPRPGTPGEGIYLSLWQEFAAARPHEWAHIFADMRTKPRQRVASVAASFMVFMGCNGGASFTHRAIEMASKETELNRERLFIAAWAMENARYRGIDHGLRTIEYMLAAEHPIENHPFCGRRISQKRVPVITMEDHDAIECMVRWWASPQAECMRSIAEPMRQAANKKMRAAMFTKELEP